MYDSTDHTLSFALAPVATACVKLDAFVAATAMEHARS
jgi:hypothetical protein